MIVKNGSSHLHAVWEEVRVVEEERDGEGQKTLLRFSSLDAALVSIGEVNAFPTPLPSGERLEQNDGLAFNLLNTVWGTNYVEWFPWREEDANLKWRFEISIGEKDKHNA